MLALNPSINEEQSCGTEERNIIIPAIDALAEKGIQAFGPYPADDFFGNGYYNEFDGVMAMYHDQAAVPFHSLFNEDGVLYTAGLPIIHTAANTTPCYYMAGYNEADAISFRHAIFLALDAFRHRETCEEAYQNPLPKLYHEKRDESEKVRFSIPKKHVPSPFPPKGGNKQNGTKGNNGNNNGGNNGNANNNAPQPAQQTDKKLTQQPNPAEKQAQPAPQKPAEQPAPQPAE